jgi:hypothetical protein
MSEHALPDRHSLVLEPGRTEWHYLRDLWRLVRTAGDSRCLSRCCGPPRYIR